MLRQFLGGLIFLTKMPWGTRSFISNIHSLRKVLSARVSQGERLVAPICILVSFHSAKNNSGSFIFVLSQLFWGGQYATVLPIHNRTKCKAILLLDYFSRFDIIFGRKYVIKNSIIAPNELILLEISTNQCACGDSWEPVMHNAEIWGCFFEKRHIRRFRISKKPEGLVQK